MNKTVTLLEFLESSGATVRIHDMGRRIVKISREDFLKFEKMEIAYPFPLQQQAWFAMSITDKSVSDQPVIWFLRFPLDETGKLQQAGRDYFIHRLFEAAAASNENTDNQLSADALKDNPHVFKPREDRMAIFHARLSRKLKQPVSRYYAHTREYLSGKQGWEQWNFLGFQGIADLVERLDEDDNESLLATAIRHLPQQPLEAVCQCLENTPCPLSIATGILQRCEHELSLAHPIPSIPAHLIRAVCMSKSVTIRNQIVTMILQSPLASDPEILGAIAARSWEWLSHIENARLYLESLAQADQETFNHCLSDLLFMPGLREILLSVIRNPERSDKLAQTFSNMMKSYS